MATPAALKALEDTQKALRDIRQKVQPLLQILRDNDNEDSRHDADVTAQAHAGIALTLGTLRFMAHRLRGNKAGGTSDPLRLELNRMRQLLVKVQKKAKPTAKTTATTNRTSPTPKQLQESETNESKKSKEIQQNQKDSEKQNRDAMKSPSTSTPVAKRRRRTK